ncbi:hypothetical protein BO70DRAFT_161778 [Aspergillus heteromorphus CBS 117.55]|uniref:Uncharacterized protein n=1 Tax=Aspergillus heteromorphus CBS 117.55 TaxID=1448321 RepID=A0A317WRQ6_9EURO|nr:uncharacterized protein BO70DRAFT_161778 [Aspergillus heteromorphus CBS 117.55]PWY89136.1 hypothetical protein BO70DRAFT_161778 [Aspergillus heteromorphus CBS 117.55]
MGAWGPGGLGQIYSAVHAGMHTYTMHLGVNIFGTIIPGKMPEGYVIGCNGSRQTCQPPGRPALRVQLWDS